MVLIICYLVGSVLGIFSLMILFKQSISSLLKEGDEETEFLITLVFVSSWISTSIIFGILIGKIILKVVRPFWKKFENFLIRKNILEK